MLRFNVVKRRLRQVFLCNLPLVGVQVSVNCWLQSIHCNSAPTAGSYGSRLHEVRLRCTIMEFTTNQKRNMLTKFMSLKPFQNRLDMLFLFQIVLVISLKILVLERGGAQILLLQGATHLGYATVNLARNVEKRICQFNVFIKLIDVWGQYIAWQG